MAATRPTWLDPGPALLGGPGRNVREEEAQALREGRVRKNRVAKPRVGQVRQHRHLHHGHDLAGLGADHGEAEDAVVTVPDESLHEAQCLAARLRPQHSAHRHPGDAHLDALTFRLAFAQSHVRERRIREHAVGNQPIARAAPPSGQIVANEPKVVFGYVRELRAAGAFAERPDIPRTRLQPIVDADITATVQLDADLAEPDPGGVGNTPGRDEDVAAFDGLLAGVREYRNADPLAGLAIHPEELGRDDNSDSFVAENPPYLIRDVGILSAHELRAGLDDRNLAAEATVSPREFEAGIAAPDHDQMRRQVIELQSVDMDERSSGLEARNGRNRRVRSDVEEDFVARQRARPAVIQAHLERLRRHKAPAPHDQLGAA